MRENERRGLDFTPQAGESPRMVRARLADWLTSLEPGTRTIGIVTHKGVIRAAISLATGWDLRSDYGEKLRREVYHRFRLDNDGRLYLDRLNLPLSKVSETL
jgi:probable phosphoglycerate mutase